MKRLLTLALILGLAQLTFAQKDKKEGLKKIENTSRVTDLESLSELSELSELGELKELSSLSELSSLASLSELSELANLAELAELSALADNANTIILPAVEIVLNDEMQTMLQNIGKMSAEIAIDAADYTQYAESIDVEQLNRMVDKVLEDAFKKKD